MNRTLRPLAALAMVALLSAGCSNALVETGNNTAATREKAVKFAECMRNNGVREFPSTTAWKKAIDACKDLQPPRALDGSTQSMEERLIMKALERHRAIQKEERSRLGTLWEDNDLVFRSVISTPLNRHNLVTRSFKPLLKKAGLPRTFQFDGLRHIAATILLLKGVHPKVAQEMLGHSTVNITLDTYSHVLPNMQDKAASAMEDALS
jgi:integrase